MEGAMIPSSSTGATVKALKPMQPSPMYSPFGAYRRRACQCRFASLHADRCRLVWRRTTHRTMLQAHFVLRECCVSPHCADSRMYRAEHRQCRLLRPPRRLRQGRNRVTRELHQQPRRSRSRSRRGSSSLFPRCRRPTWTCRSVSPPRRRRTTEEARMQDHHYRVS